MTFIYPIIFHKTQEGRIKGYFPDLEGCSAEGETVELAVRDAMEAEYNWIMLELEEEDPVLPAVSHLQDLELKEGEFARNISVKVRLTEGWEE
ncbi:MAG: type II toxin-antitoxin system HicB family antitoxin [Lachnospiraceae bacterium]|nr:type II toxin-antitoxin system HicB family antitoxin [Lachnospiraceae bacterium]MBQ9642982.1 type II toxin-antitoxin system HicB family antitoxin [Lachnospiraceae bacterium]